MRVRYRAIKGMSGDVELGRAALLQGENATGKSALVAAVHLAFTGKLAAMRMGKDGTQDAGRLLKAIADGGWAEVELNGRTVRRTLEATAKKARILTYCDGKEGAEAEAAAAELAGDLLFADFRRLVAAGDKERADVLATYLPQPDDGEKRLWAISQAMYHIEAALRPPPKRGQKAMVREAGRLGAVEAKAARAALDALATANAAGDALAEIFGTLANKGAPERPVDTATMIEALRRRANEVDEERKTAGKIAVETAKSGGEAVALAKEIPDLEAQVNALRAAVADVEKARRDEAARLKRVADLTERIREMSTERDDRTPAASSLPDKEEAAARCRKALEAEKLSRPSQPDTSALAKLEEAIRPLNDEIARLTPLAEAADRFVARLATIKAERSAHEAAKPTPPEEDAAALRTKLDELRIKAAQAVEQGKAKRAKWDDAATGQCPIMGRGCPVPAELKAFAAGILAEGKALAESVRDAQTKIAELAEHHESLITARDAYGAASAAWTAKAASLDSDLRVATSDADVSRTAAERLPKAQAELAPLAREAELLRGQRDGYNATLNRWTEAVRTLEDAERRARDDCAEAVDARDRIAELANDIARTKNQLSEISEPVLVPTVEAAVSLPALESRLKDAHAAKARVEVLAGLDVDGLSRATDMWKAAHRGAAQGLAACIQAATQPVVDKITENLRRMGFGGDAAFHVDLSERSFGLVNGGHLLDAEVLSGGEAILFAAAMLSALPAKGGPRVLTLESAELSPRWLTRLLEGLDVEAFDAVIIASCHSPAEIPPNWTVVQMGGGEA